MSMGKAKNNGNARKEKSSCSLGRRGTAEHGAMLQKALKKERSRKQSSSPVVEIMPSKHGKKRNQRHGMEVDGNVEKSKKRVVQKTDRFVMQPATFVAELSDVRPAQLPTQFLPKSRLGLELFSSLEASICNEQVNENKRFAERQQEISERKRNRFSAFQDETNDSDDENSVGDEELREAKRRKMFIAPATFQPSMADISIDGTNSKYGKIYFEENFVLGKRTRATEETKGIKKNDTHALEPRIILPKTSSAEVKS